MRINPAAFLLVILLALVMYMVAYQRGVTNAIKSRDQPQLASARLMNLLLDRMLMLQPGWKVKWSISISYWNDNPPADMKVIPRQGSYSSGDAE